MGSIDVERRSAAPWLIPLGLVALVALVVIYRPLGIYLAHLGTRDDGDEGLGIVAWIVAAWLIHERRESLKSLAITPDRWGLVLLAGGGLVNVVGHRLTMYSLLSLSLPLVFGGCLWSLCGRQWVKALWFPLLLLVGTTPLPNVIAKGIGFPMQRMVAQLSAVVLDFLGMPVNVAGVTFTFEGHTVQVSEGCSGWRSFSAASWLLLVLLYRQRPAGWFQWFWYPVLMLPLTIAANLLRVVTVVAGIRFGQPWVAESPWHEILGLFFFLPAAWLMVSMVLSGPSSAAPEGADPPGPPERRLSLAAIPRGGLWRVAAVLWLVSALGLHAQAQARAAWQIRPLPDLPEQLGEWKRSDYQPAGPWHLIANYRHPSGRQVRASWQVPANSRERPYPIINWMLKHGHVLDGKETTTLETGRRQVPVCLAAMTSGSGPASVAVTYLGSGGAITDPIEARLSLLGRQLLGGSPTPWLMVAVIAPDAQTALEFERLLLTPADGWVAEAGR